MLAWLPAYALLIVMAIGDDIVFSNLIIDYVPLDVQQAEDFNKIIVLAQIQNVVDGIQFGKPPEWVTAAGEAWTKANSLTPSPSEDPNQCGVSWA